MLSEHAATHKHSVLIVMCAHIPQYHTHVCMAPERRSPLEAEQCWGPKHVAHPALGAAHRQTAEPMPVSLQHLALASNLCLMTERTQAKNECATRSPEVAKYKGKNLYFIFFYFHEIMNLLRRQNKQKQRINFNLVSLCMRRKYLFHVSPVDSCH